MDEDDEKKVLKVYSHQKGTKCYYDGGVSFRQKAMRPKGIGLRKRTQWRINENKSKFTMRRYRYGYRLIFRLPRAREYARNLRRLPLPETCDKLNQHGGVMPAMPGELYLSGKQAATILEKCASNEDITYDQLQVISNTISYLHTLCTGDNGQNWEEVSQVWESIKKKSYPNKLGTMIPTHVPSIDAIKTAFSREWIPSCGLSLALWINGLLAAWAWAVYGCRPRVDMSSLKKSDKHVLSKDQRWGLTEFLGGRNKLHEKKSGTRPWSMWYVCLCPGGIHKDPPREFFKTFGKYGNPSEKPKFCTICPLNALKLKIQLTKKGLKMHLFSQWATKYKCFAKRNHGSMADVAIDWFEAQGALDDNTRYCTNSGRRACARWLQETHAPYHEGFEIHGDLYGTWINYQPNCMKSNFCRREQSRDPHVATAPLRRFAYMIGRGYRVKEKGLDLSTKLMLGLLESNGQALLAQSIVERHKQTSMETD